MMNVENMEYLMTPLIEDFRLFGCIANSLEDGCLPRIGASNDQDAKTRRGVSNAACSVSLSTIYIVFLEVGTGKRHCRWNA